MNEIVPISPHKKFIGFTMSISGHGQLAIDKVNSPFEYINNEILNLPYFYNVLNYFFILLINLSKYNQYMVNIQFVYNSYIINIHFIMQSTYASYTIFVARFEPWFPKRHWIVFWHPMTTLLCDKRCKVFEYHITLH